MADMAEFLADRRHALLSMDKAIFLAYCKKYGVRFLPMVKDDDAMFWATIHKARSSPSAGLPAEERQKSIEWLRERGMKPMEV